MSTINRPAFLLFLSIMFPLVSYAQGGSTGMSVLKIGVGARTVAMGDAGVASAVHGTELHYNPALMTGTPTAAITIMHNEWVQHISTEYLSTTIPMDGWSLGFSLGLTTVPEIEVRNVPGDALGTFDSHNFVGGISMALPLSDQVSAGVSIKYLFEKIYVDGAAGYAFDFGLRYRPFIEGDLQTLKTGLSIANLGSMSELRSQPTQLPALARFGVSYSLPMAFANGSLLIEADGVSIVKERSFHAVVGAEFDYSQLVFLRLGYQSGFEMRSISTGLGVSYSVIRFDYAYSPFSEGFGAANTISLSILL